MSWDHDQMAQFGRYGRHGYQPMQGNLPRNNHASGIENTNATNRLLLQVQDATSMIHEANSG